MYAQSPAYTNPYEESIYDHKVSIGLSTRRGDWQWHTCHGGDMVPVNMQSVDNKELAAVRTTNSITKVLRYNESISGMTVRIKITNIAV